MSGLLWVGRIIYYSLGWIYRPDQNPPLRKSENPISLSENPVINFLRIGNVDKFILNMILDIVHPSPNRFEVSFSVAMNSFSYRLSLFFLISILSFFLFLDFLWSWLCGEPDAYLQFLVTQFLDQPIWMGIFTNLLRFKDL